MEDIDVYEIKRMDVKGAVVIDGFPSVGLVSSIVANYLVNVLKLEQIGVVDSIYFPTVSLIRESEPYNPVRMYAGRKKDDGNSDQVVVFISEFQPPANLIKPIASTILDWTIEQKCSMLISPEGLVVDRGEDEDEEPKEPDDSEMSVEVYGIGSTPKVREMIAKHDVSLFEEGVITGVAGVLLNEGKRRDFDVMSLLAEAHPDYPDARAAARIIEVIDKILLKSEIDAKPLYDEAEKVEGQIKTIHKQTESAKAHKMPPTSPHMYG